MRAYRGRCRGRVADGTVVLRRMIYQSRKIEAGELRGARYIRTTRTYGAARITLRERATRTRCLNSAIYQALLSSEPFHVAINVSTAGTSYFKALWHRHAHAKFTSRRSPRISAALFLRASLSRRSGDLSAVAVTASKKIRNESRIKIEHGSIDIVLATHTRFHSTITNFQTRERKRERKNHLYRINHCARKTTFHRNDR